MRRLRTAILVLSCLCLWACQTTTKSGAPVDHREDQASRQMERDLAEAEKKQTRKPVDMHSSAGQGVIDQPR